MKKKYVQGTMVKIPIDQHFHTYARVLVDGFVEVFDCKTDGEIQDVDAILATNILFTIYVYSSAFKKKRWEIVGYAPFDPEAKPMPLRFIQDILDPTQCEIVDMYGNGTPATIDECRGLERFVVWNAEAVEARIKAHYEGRIDPGTYMERLREAGESYP